MTEPIMAITDAIDDPELFGRWFKKPETWRAWRVFLKSLFALPMAEDELALYRQCTGRDTPPADRVNEAWLVVGRRGGKSLNLAILGAFMAAFVDWSEHLVPGELAVVTILAADRRQARAIYRYLRAMFTHVPLLAGVLVNANDDEIELSNGITIEIATASYRTIRGATVVCALCDEVSFWRSADSVSPDYEVMAALRPSMATVPNAMLLCASSPYAKRGVLWDAYRKFYGKPGPVLVWSADTRTMNPSLPARVVDDAYERDETAAASEYGRDGVIVFRSDLETFIAREVVEAATVPDRHELPPMAGVAYAAFTDPSGGSVDSFTLAIAHRTIDGRAVVDAVREARPPFGPDTVVQEFAALLKSYGLSAVTGDHYAGLWPRERFVAHGIDYQLSERTKSDIYRDCLPLLNSGRVELLALPRLSAQLCALERRTARSGKDSIDHPPGGHDDVSNAVAGAVVLVGGAAAPALWHRQAFGAPVVAGHIMAIFAVIMAGKRGDAAAVYFATPRVPGSAIIVLDVEAAPLSPRFLRATGERLHEMVAKHRNGVVALFGPKALADEAQRLGINCRDVDALLSNDGDDLALSAATHILGGRVALTADTLDKATRLPLGGLLDASAGDDDPIRLAALVGIALALDAGRSLTTRAA